MNIKQIKERVRLLKLSNPNMSAYEILKRQRFVLGFLPTELQDEIPQGCYFKEAPLRFVLIHPDLDRYNSNLVYIHELGHATIHPDVNTMELGAYDPVFVKKIEREADVFVAEFSLDDDVFLKNPTLSNEKIAQKKNVLLRHVELKLKYLDKAYLPNKYDNETEYINDFRYFSEYEHMYSY